MNTSSIRLGAFQLGIICMAALLLTGGFPEATGGESRAFRLLGVSGLKMPFYGARGGTPVAVVHVQRFRKEFDRKGFYRIGMMPLLIAEDVTIEVWREAEFREVLGEIKTILGPSSTQGARVEMRRVTFRFPNESTPRLTADSARFKPDGAWDLRGSIQFTAGSESLRARHGRLTVTGAEAGRLQLDGRGAERSAHLFSHESSPAPSQPIRIAP